MRCTDKALAKHLMGEAGIPTPEFRSFAEECAGGLGLAEALGELERSPGYPLVVKPAHGGSALGVKFAAEPTELPSGDGGGALLRRPGGGGALRQGARPRRVGARRRRWETGWAPTRQPQALPVVEAIPREQEFYAYESRYEIGMTTFVCPAELPAEITARAQELALEVYRLLGCHGVARVDLMLGQGERRADGAGGQRGARPHGNQPAAKGGGRGGDRLLRAGGPDPAERLHALWSIRRRIAAGTLGRRARRPGAWQAAAAQTRARTRPPAP